MTQRLLREAARNFRRSTALFVGCSILAFLPESIHAQSLTASRITSAIDASQRISLENSVPARVSKAEDLGVVKPELSDMILLLRRSDQQTTALQALMTDQQNPSSAHYHHWLTPQEFGQQFGASEEDIQKIEQWLEQNGFQVKSVSASRQSINFSGSAAQVSAAFHTELHQFRTAGSQSFISNKSLVQIPAALSGIVSGVAGLNNFRTHALHRNTGLIQQNRHSGALSMLSHVSTSSTSPQLTTTQSPQHIVTPGDFATMYNLGPAVAAGLDGTGQSIAIVAKSDIFDSDVQSFRSSFGLPAAKIDRYVVNTNPGYAESEGEAALDVEWSGAVARNATSQLVLASDSTTTDGVVLAMQYIVDHNLAPVVSVSWGLCELFEGAENQFVAQVWEQAAAQGMSVVVSTGDSGSPLCDAGYDYADYGLAVNALASSPNVVAMGGTDLYGNYTSSSKYWDTANAADFSSAKSYIPEIPWNDTCANPKVLDALQKLGATDTDTESLCNDASRSSWVSVVGGSGGRSTCTTSNGSTCISGYAKPSWQVGTVGMPSDGSRDLPDVALFAGDGLWGSAYVYCESDISPTGTCDYTNPDNVTYMAAGGTSFGAPAFAGIIALLTQQQGAPLGNLNPVLYKLAQGQYTNSNLAQACTTEQAASGNSCVFYDITQSNNATPCATGSKDCITNVSTHTYGILSGYSSNIGYDMTSGLGTLNISNLLNAWKSIELNTITTATSLSLAKTSATFGDTLTGTVTVTASSGNPTGVTSVTTDSYGQGAFALNNGTSIVTLPALSAGTHNLVAVYPGSAPYMGSNSSAVAVTIAKASTAVSALANRTTLSGATSFTVLAKVLTKQAVSPPTGTVTFTDSTNNTTLGTAAMVAGTAADGTWLGTATASLSGTGLASGSNQIVATYDGDSNFVSSSGAPLAIAYTPAFTIIFSQSSLTIPAGGSSSIQVHVKSNTGTLAANTLLTCPSTLPSFLTCSFSPAILPAGATSIDSTLTLYATPLLGSFVPQNAPGRFNNVNLQSRYAALALLLGVPLYLSRRKAIRVLVIVLGVGTMTLAGCSSSTPANTSLTLSADSTSVAYHKPITLTATLANGSKAEAGQIVFTDGQSELGRISLVNNAATLTTSTLAVGSHTFTARFAGDKKDSSATSNSLAVGVTYSFNLNVQAADSLGNSATATIPTVVQ